MERIRRIVDPHARTARVRSLPSAAVGGLLLVALAVTTLFAASGPGRDDSGPILWMPESVRQWEGVLAEAGREHGVDPALLSILALVESNGNPEAVSRTGALGLLQIMPATGAAIAERRGIEGFDPERLMDPSINADFGAYLLGEYLERFRDDRDPAATVEWAAAAYNGGLKRAEAHRRGVAELSDETLKYKGLVRKLWLQRDAVEPPEFVERRLAKMESTAR